MKYTVLIGAARAQKLPALVCEYSIRRRTKLPLNIVHTFDEKPPEPGSVANRSRTGFSFVRFLLPEKAGFEGIGVYLDSDMILLSDIEGLFSMMGPKSPPILCTRNLASVIVADCHRTRWDIRKIFEDLNNRRWTYEQVMELCAFAPDVDRAIPNEWNSLDRVDSITTKLLHYTDMVRQCWRIRGNYRRVDDVWRRELRDALIAKFIDPKTVFEEISLGNITENCVLGFAEARTEARKALFP